jgi:hypothetical protein
MSLSELTSPTAVRKAIAEFDRLGQDLFLRKYGFGSARSYFLIYEGRQYDSKAIAGVAHGYQYPDKGPLLAKDFTGGKLSFDAGGHLVKLGFDVPGVDKRTNGWSLAECETTVRAYFDCLRKRLSGESFNRTQVLQAVASVIGRSRDAVDYKFQNIDGVLSEGGLPRLNNAVAANIQKLLRYVVLDPLAAHADVFELTNPASVESVQDESVTIVPIPVIEPDRLDRPDDVTSLRAMKTDFARRDAVNRALGQSAEEWVVHLERKQLNKAGRADLAKKVRWVSQEDGDGLGYDIASFEPDGTVIYIEVKATNQGAASPFYLSETELRVSNARGEVYRLYRVFEFSQSPKVFIVKGPLSENLSLRAVQHIALPANMEHVESPLSD